MKKVDDLSKSTRIFLDDLVFDTGKREVTRRGTAIPLPKLSFRLFVVLTNNAPDVVTHEQLINEVWGGRPVSTETITQRIKLLRRALGDDARKPRYIGLVRGQGYRMLPARSTSDTVGSGRDTDSIPAQVESDRAKLFSDRPWRPVYASFGFASAAAITGLFIVGADIPNAPFVNPGESAVPGLAASSDPGRNLPPGPAPPIRQD